MFLVYVLASSVFFTLGDIVSKIWSLKTLPEYFVAAIGLYALAGVFVLYSLREDSLSLFVLVQPPLTIIGVLFASYFFFGERLSLTQYLAAVVILLAMVVLLWNPKI